MTATNGEGTRQDVPELAISYAPEPGWSPALTRIGSTHHLVLTAPGGTGVVFARSGPDESLDAFVAGLGDLMTTVEVVARGAGELAGRPARRVELIAHGQAHDAYFDDPDHGLVHAPQPDRRERIVAVEPVPLAGRDPILIGFRLPDERMPDLAPAAERVVASVRFGPT
jgi:hypothetical protein